MRSVVLQVVELSLDGFIGEEDTEFFQFCRDLPDDPVYEQRLVSSLRRASLHIMGRVTYQGMAGHFPTAAGPIAEVMNNAPKAVFSRTLGSADWAGTTIVSGDIGEELEKLRRQGDGEILAHGGLSFAQQLASHDLVDEYRLNVFPFVAGSGRTLFADVAKPAELELVSSTAFDGGQIALVYRRARGD